MAKLKAFLKKKDIEISARRYGIDALGAMAQGLFCTLLIGTILNTLGSQFHIGFLTAPIYQNEAVVFFYIRPDNGLTAVAESTGPDRRKSTF